MFSLFDHSFLIVNPYDQPVLPRSLQNIDSMISISDDASNTEYHRLQGTLLHEQTIPLNSLVSTIVPTRRCFMPILSFVTDSNSLDLPIPLLCDWIVVSSGTIPGCEDLCEAIREPLIAFNKHPLQAAFRNRINRIFFRGNLSSERRNKNEQ